MLIVIMGKGASGKNCLVDKMEENGFAEFIPTDTTRPMRPGEIPGKTYNYLTNAEFDTNLADGKYLETNEYNTLDANGNKLLWKYGSSIDSMTKAANASELNVSILTPSGKEAVKEAGIQHVSILIDASRAEIERRMIEIGKREIKEARRRIDADEIDFKDVTADIVINTDNMTPDEVYNATVTALSVLKK